MSPKIGKDVINRKNTLTKQKSVSPIGFQSWKAFKKQELKSQQKLGVEKGIKPLVDAINKHPFMGTISSCEGHPKREEYPYAYVNFLVRSKDRLKVVRIFDEKILAYKGVEIEDRTKEFDLSDFFIAGFPKDVLYITIRINNKLKRDEIVSLLVKKIRGI